MVVLDLDRGEFIYEDARRFGRLFYGPLVGSHSLVVDIPTSEISTPNTHIVLKVNW